MKRFMNVARAGNFGLLALMAIGLASGCWFDDTLREYLDARFWLPFAKSGRHFENRAVRRVNQAFAGMIWCKQHYRYDVTRWLRGDVPEFTNLVTR